MFKKLKKDLQAYMKNDPAARNKFEVVMTYSGFHAIIAYRIANFFHRHRCKLLARMISQWARFCTGVEIHPAAQIDSGFCIDHGAGVVIGETAVIGKNVLIYQNVTLGGTGKDRGKRHPTIEDNVMISAGAKVLGGFTVGEGSKIGANSVVLSEVPKNSTVVGIPGRIVKLNGERLQLDQMLPDPIEDEIAVLREILEGLEQKTEQKNQGKKRWGKQKDKDKENE